MSIETIFNVYDNSSVYTAKITSMYRSNRSYYMLGDLGTCVPQFFKRVKKHLLNRRNILFGLIIGIKKWTRRRIGVWIRFQYNKMLIFSRARKFLGTRVYGKICIETYEPRLVPIYYKAHKAGYGPI